MHDHQIIDEKKRFINHSMKAYDTCSMWYYFYYNYICSKHVTSTHSYPVMSRPENQWEWEWVDYECSQLQPNKMAILHKYHSVYLTYRNDALVDIALDNKRKALKRCSQIH